MRAMVFGTPGAALQGVELPEPVPGPGQVRVRVSACGVCRTDLHVRDGELPNAKTPLILGHEIVGAIDAIGDGVPLLRPGDRGGGPWLAGAGGACRPRPAGGGDPG